MAQGLWITAAALIGASFIAYFALRWARSAVDTQAHAPSSVFTLAELRAMHAQGQLTDAEFQAMKTRLIQREREQAAARPKPPESRKA